MKKFKVLLVEDNLILRKATEIFLRDCRCEVEFALNGEEGIKLFKENKYDFILMDIIMPKINGIVATEKIREMEIKEKRGFTPIIGYSLLEKDDPKLKIAKQKGVNFFIRKPLLSQELTNILNDDLFINKDAIQDLMKTRDDYEKDIKLPDFKVLKVTNSLSEVTDWGIKKMNIPFCWDITEGENITVMVIDTGCSDHYDLEDNILFDKCKSFVPYEKDIFDHQGHSTHCSGIIAAAKNNRGVVGVAPKAKIIACKVLDSYGTGNNEWVNQALEYAIEIKPDVISMSLGGSADDPKTHELIKQLYSMNIPIFCAAGNAGKEDSVSYPAKYDETIAIAAIDKNDALAKFSSRGKEVNFAFPGEDIYSCWLNNDFAKLSGTSMACPYAAGVCALYLSTVKKHDLPYPITVEMIRELYKKYSVDKGAPGFDNGFGWGVIDVSDMIKDEDWRFNGLKPEPVVEKTSIFQSILLFFRRIFR